MLFYGLTIILLTLHVAFANLALHPLNPRLIAVGDVHGDMDNFRAILMHAQVIDCDGNWTGEAATVVQMGDVCDRGPHSHTIIEYIDEVLIPQARQAGGEFIQILGNHELLNMRGDHRFTMPELIKAFGGLAAWTQSFAVTGVYGRRNAALDTIVIRRGTAFVHAGVLPEDAALGVEAINQRMRAAMLAQNWSDPFLDINGPAWTRQQVYAAMRTGECSLVRGALDALSSHEAAQGRPPVARLVVGHTIQPNGAVSVFCDGTFIATDVSSSQFMQGGGHLAFVEFREEVRVDKAGGLEGGKKAGAGRIVGVPTYPPIPWKRHGLRPVAPPMWIQTARPPSNLTAVVASEREIPLLLIFVASVIVFFVLTRARHLSFLRQFRKKPAHSTV